MIRDISEMPAYLNALAAEMRGFPEKGRVADYIPELKNVAIDQFGISVCLKSGAQYSAGDAQTRFSIQSVSKLITLVIALGRHGQQLWARVGREPSSQVFNSVQELEARNGIPPNPFVNSGAIVTTDTILVGATPKATLAEILQFTRFASTDNEIHIDPAVASSEMETSDRNHALAYILKAFGNLNNSCERTLGTYFHHCAISMNCMQLAKFGRFLAYIHPSDSVIQNTHIRNINALMLTSGHYEGSGIFAFKVGLPAKSGVGGGILAIAPGIASVAVWSPGLDQHGNSMLGTAALERLSEAFGWSVFSRP